jgi:DNA modification methylase|tara:strand:+ start:875 stop:1561 length:687 start_codon:yes stop_codon:yes gene_type:complete
MKWNQFVCDDAFNIFPKIKDQSVDLTFTSLPDISQGPWGKDIKEYQAFQNKSCDEMARITKPKGFVVISQTDRKINGEILPNHITYYQAMIRNGFKLKDYKIMVRNNPVDKRDMYYFNYQHTLVFTKEGTIKRGGDWLKNIMVYETQRMGNMKGPLNLYVWNEHFIRLILEYLSKENDKVIDPFAGSGVVPYIAKKMKRQYYGIELDKEVYDNSLFKRVAPFENLVGV